jgi:MSHA pilin protein MshC
MKALKYKLKFNLGFTLVELIIVLIILGVLSVTVIPKFFGPSLFDSYTIRDQAMSALRTMQLRAMQMTADNSCHYINISATKLDLAPPTPTAIPMPITHVCSTAPDTVNNPDYLVVQIDSSTTDLRFEAKDGQAIATSFTYIKFDDLGRASNLNCTNTCKISIKEASLVAETAICISGQGAIYGC